MNFINQKKTQQIMTLYYFRGLSTYLISQVLNLDPVTVKNIIEEEISKESFFVEREIDIYGKRI